MQTQRKFIPNFVIAPVLCFVIITHLYVENWPEQVKTMQRNWNDAQKTMGIITLALVTATNSNAFARLPHWLDFLRMPTFGAVPIWVKILCALTMAAGTAAGGWRIIRTMGHKMVKLQPVHGFAAETTAALIIQLASHWGIPLSTTHVIATSIMGVGAAKRFSGVKWGIVERIVWAWIFTLPATFFLSYLLVRLEAFF